MAKQKGEAKHGPAPLKTYGLQLNVELSQLEIELLCFRTSRRVDEGGLGRQKHFENAAKLMWPDLVWNPWLDLQIGSLCNYSHVGWAGCATSGKTYSASMYGMAWWASSPEESAVILTSTTAKMIRKRQWSAIQDLLHKTRGFPGHVVDSKTIIQARQGDDKHGIFAQPVAEGSVSKAVANIQGFHARRILLIIDEATDTPEAIFEAESNISKGCDEFQMLVIGNPHSYYDQHGRFCEPRDGWKSVNVQDEEWETKRGVCIRFDGVKSPNVLAGKNLYPYLLKIEDLKKARLDDGENSPKFWKFTRGFWSPDGVTSTVLSEALCLKFDVTSGFTFLSKYTTVAGLDPAFGGDRCVLQFARLGDKPDGLGMMLLFTDTVTIQIDAGSPEPVAYQIARQVKQECEARGCSPEDLAVDSTGNGAGVCDVIAQEWSRGIVRIGFGTVASDMPISDFDQKKSSDAYNDKVTELWYSMREWVKADQVRGLSKDAITEFCGRFYEERGRKICLESKRDMKSRTGRSPDKADAASLVIEIARRRGAKNALKSPNGGDVSWERMAREVDSIYSPDLLYSAE